MSPAAVMQPGFLFDALTGIPVKVPDAATGLLAALLLLVWGYAEIHYRLPGIPSRLFKKEPEIIFDLPFRAQAQPVPLFLFVKDSDRFPVELIGATVTISDAAGRPVARETFPLNQAVSARFWSRTLELPAAMFPGNGHYRVDALLQYRCGDKLRRLHQDNYPGISHDPLEIYIANTPLPALPGLYWGDLHTHSNYTEDQIEFGAPLRETARCARALGLHFIAVTDHSYDMDNLPGDYTRNDPELRKWEQFRAEVARLNHELDGFTILPGEEVSVGNQRRQNVHCLVLGSSEFYPGAGDSGDCPLFNRPTLALPELYARVQASGNGAVIAAAHPREVPPRTHRWILNRGHWRGADLAHPALDFWQILNGRVDASFRDGYRAWIGALLSGQEVGILGGTDAHGNFNNFRQLTVPFFKMVRERDQCLGQMRSGVYASQPLDADRLLEKLKRKQAIVSNGPAARLEVIQEGKTFPLGSHIRAERGFRLHVSAASSLEFGPLNEITLHTGRLGERQEQVLPLPCSPAAYRIDYEQEFSAGLPEGYLRLKVKAGGENETFCLTNPIWVG